MKATRSLIMCVLIYLVGFGILSAIPITQATDLTTQTVDLDVNTTQVISPMTIPDNGETVGIIVGPAEWNDITYGTTLQAVVAQYKLQLEQTGYQVLLQTAGIGGGTVQELRTFLQTWYTIYSISGVVLIGNFAYARFYHAASTNFAAETFICDLYLTDLDGTWTDGDMDTIYDGHTSGTGDIYPEIFLGRIDATTRTLGGLANPQNIINVLNKAVNYRTGLVSRTHQAITYIDDDWKLWADGTNDNWPAWLNSPYPIRTDVYTTTTTTAADWTTRLTQNYEWAHLCVHSGATPAQHYFGPGGVGEGTITSAQIHSIQPTFNYYNLFCCHGADWLAVDCLATTYLYSSSYSLAVVGTTKTGGMLGGTSFYNSLGQDKTIGQALNDWFQGMVGYSSTEYIEWFYGMTILGDPFSTINYDFSLFEPTVYSSTHPNESNWYSYALPQMDWTIPIDVNGIAGYYYIFDQNPSTMPTTGTGTYTATNSTTPAFPLSDGIWYFHLLTIDGAGNEVVSHYTLNIDTSQPTVAIITADNTEMAPGNLVLSWTVTDTLSGYDYADIKVNSSLVTTVHNPTSEYSLNLAEEGNYLVSVNGFNGAGLSSSDFITVTVTIPIGIPPYYYIIGGAAVVLVVVIIIVASKRKKAKAI